VCILRLFAFRRVFLLIGTHDLNARPSNSGRHSIATGQLKKFVALSLWRRGRLARGLNIRQAQIDNMRALPALLRHAI
jgi:hypothetical protein